MNIFIIGSGNMAAAFTTQAVKAGHIVTVMGRNADKANALAKELGASAVTLATAAASVAAADVVLLATGYGDATAALSSLASLANLAGKTVIDLTNPVSADYMALNMALTIGHSSSAAEEIAKAVPVSHVIKAFNTLFAQVLSDGADFGAGNTASVFYAGDNAAAKERVRSLITSLGFVPVDAGGLNNARYLEPLAGLNIYLGYGAGLGTAIAPAWLQRAAA